MQRNLNTALPVTVLCVGWSVGCSSWERSAVGFCHLASTTFWNYRNAIASADCFDRYYRLSDFHTIVLTLISAHKLRYRNIGKKFHKQHHAVCCCNSRRIHLTDTGLCLFSKLISDYCSLYDKVTLSPKSHLIQYLNKLTYLCIRCLLQQLTDCIYWCHTLKSCNRMPLLSQAPTLVITDPRLQPHTNTLPCICNKKNDKTYTNIIEQSLIGVLAVFAKDNLLVDTHVCWHVKPEQQCK